MNISSYIPFINPVFALQRARTLAQGHQSFAATKGYQSSYITAQLPDKFIRLMKTAGYAEHQILRQVIAILFFSILFLLLGLILLDLLGITLAFIPLLFSVARYKILAQRRVYSFERDYTALLLSLASALRTGADPLGALCKSHALFPKHTPMHVELVKLQEYIDSGLSEETVITRFANSIDHPDLPLFRTAFILSRKEGASMGECLHRLVKVTRNRQSFRRKIRAAVAMQKLSAFGIGFAASAIGIIQFTTNKELLTLTMKSAIGSQLMLAALLLIVLGIGWMLFISRTKV